MRVLISTLLVAILLVKSGSCRMECRQVPDEKYESSIRLEVTWFLLENEIAANGNITAGQIREEIESRINRTLADEEDLTMQIMFLDPNFDSADPFMRTLVFGAEKSKRLKIQVNIKAEGEEDSRDGRRWDPRLMNVLDRIVDCKAEETPCKTSVVGDATLMKPNQLSEAGPISPLERRPFVLVASHIRLKVGDNSTKSDPSKCDICKEIELNKAPSSSFLQSSYSFTKSTVIKIWDLMEPTYWLFLTVGIWLAVCLCIAVVIQGRDKRRLRLFLEEREEYPFSAKRQPHENDMN